MEKFEIVKIEVELTRPMVDAMEQFIASHIAHQDQDRSIDRIRSLRSWYDAHGLTYASLTGEKAE